MSEDDSVTAATAASYLGVTVRHLYNLRSQDKGPRSSRRGRRLIFRRADLDEYLTRERITTTRGGTR
jgi:excisionase family DNA binding protein